MGQMRQISEWDTAVYMVSEVMADAQGNNKCPSYSILVNMMSGLSPVS